VLSTIVAEIQGEPLTVGCQLISLCLVEESDGRWQIVQEYPFRGQNLLPENEHGLSSRPCQPSDRTFICAMVEETLKPLVSAFYTWERERFDENFAATWHKKLLILADDRPVGYIQFDDSAPDHLYVAGLFLAPVVHGRGWGRWLLQFMEQQAGDRPVRLHVWENNPALDFYRRHGYRAIRVEGHKILMEKR
jgi:ribosomal protein S18 acetylase RimI-like enzyme